MFKKIRRAFIKLFNKRSIDILDDQIRYHNYLSKNYGTNWYGMVPEEDFTSEYYRELHIIDALQECKRLITCEKEIEL